MTPLTIQGVGNGTQACNWKMTVPIAAPNRDGAAGLHTITTPIAEGYGENLPGLLGVRSLEEAKAILDVDKRMLYFPGPGEVQIILPPGSLELPLGKVPSGHLAIIIDDYEKIAKRRGGIPERTLQLHTQQEVTPGGTSSTTPVDAEPAKTSRCEGRKGRLWPQPTSTTPYWGPNQPRPKSWC